MKGRTLNWIVYSLLLVGFLLAALSSSRYRTFVYSASSYSDLQETLPFTPPPGAANFFSARSTKGNPSRLGAWIVRFDADTSDARSWAVSVVSGFDDASYSPVVAEFSPLGKDSVSFDFSEYGLPSVDWWDVDQITNGVVCGDATWIKQPFVLIDDDRARVYYVLLGWAKEER